MNFLHAILMGKLANLLALESSLSELGVRLVCAETRKTSRQFEDPVNKTIEKIYLFKARKFL